MRSILLLCLLCACDPTSVFVRDVRPLPDGSMLVVKCEADRDLMGRNVNGRCHSETFPPAVRQ